jgi:hypothetical protein
MRFFAGLVSMTTPQFPPESAFVCIKMSPHKQMAAQPRKRSEAPVMLVYGAFGGAMMMMMAAINA